MLPGDTPEDDRCIFSGVLVEGLWGTKSAAFSKREPNKITSQSLAKYLRTEVPKVADRYQFTLNPSALPTFSDGDDTPLTPPAFALTQRMANKAALATPGACAQGGAPMRCHASNDSALWIASYASRPSRNTGYSKNLAALNGEGCAQAAIC